MEMDGSVSSLVRNSSEPDIAVLLSGGIDSFACAEFYCSMDRSVCGVFIDYGQLGAEQERKSANMAAAHLSIQLLTLTASSLRQTVTGEIPARNAFLLCYAAMQRPSSTNAVAIGIHAGTEYLDCSPNFIKHSKKMLSFQGTPVDILTPFLQMQKEDIVAYAIKQGLPLEKTYSCEAGCVPPCGSCLSCLDRKDIDARS
ncbi:tRNA methyl transferase-like protein [bacterium]|nr:MAG: tRNA methyl transferase-like protein [bacterium]